MIEKIKNPAPVAAGNEGNSKANPCRQYSIIGPRHRRLLVALLSAAEVSREQADRIAHASNSPHHIGELRKRYGIPVRMRMASGIDHDGQKTRYGMYSLDSEGKAIARQRLMEASQCASSLR